jgi:hypothetical protein
VKLTGDQTHTPQDGANVFQGIVPWGRGKGGGFCDVSEEFQGTLYVVISYCFGGFI